MAKMIYRLENLFSRKFIVSITCIMGGISLIKSGAFLSGVSALITSCVGYLVAEGIIDMKNISKITDEYKKADTQEKIVDLKDFDL